MQIAANNCCHKFAANNGQIASDRRPILTIRRQSLKKEIMG